MLKVSLLFFLSLNEIKLIKILAPTNSTTPINLIIKGFEA